MTMFGRFSCAATGMATHVSAVRIAAAKRVMVAVGRCILVSFLTPSVLELYVDDACANGRTFPTERASPTSLPGRDGPILPFCANGVAAVAGHLARYQCAPDRVTAGRITRAWQPGAIVVTVGPMLHGRNGGGDRYFTD